MDAIFEVCWLKGRGGEQKTRLRLSRTKYGIKQKNLDRQAEEITG